MSQVLLPEFSVIKLSGPEAAQFLQGQVTCDVKHLESQPWIAGCHCNAKGKAWSAFIAVQQNEDILLIMHKDSALNSLAEFKKYGVFAKVEIQDDNANWTVMGATMAVDNAINIALADNHFIALCHGKLEGSADNQAWWYNELLSGRAHLTASSSGEYVPQMLNLQALDYISFNKGCYMGQEMVARMRYLGKNKRALYIATCDNAVNVNAGDDVAIDLGGNKRTVGKVLLRQTYNDKTAIQCVLPNDTDMATPLWVGQDFNEALVLQPLPYQIEQYNKG